MGFSYHTVYHTRVPHQVIQYDCSFENQISGGPISLAAKCHNNFTKATEDGVWVLASCVVSPESQRHRDEKILYMKLKGSCFLNGPSEV